MLDYGFDGLPTWPVGSKSMLLHDDCEMIFYENSNLFIDNGLRNVMKNEVLVIDLRTFVEALSNRYLRSVCYKNS